MITYENLFEMLKFKEMKKTDLLKVISAGSLSKLSKNKNLQMEVINKICAFLETQPNNIMTYYEIMSIEKIIPEKDAYETLLYENGFKQRITIWYPNNTYFGEDIIKSPETFISKKEYEEVELFEICEKENSLPKDFINEFLAVNTGTLALKIQQRKKEK